jgi:hypothetical protein
MKKANNLSLHQMWELHNLMGDGDEKEYLIDEVSSILDRISTFELIQILQLLYTGFLAKDYNPVEMMLMLVRGLKINRVFEFSDFVKGLSNGSSNRK